MRERPLLGVSACLFAGDEVLLVRRGRAPFEGRFSLPGGKVEFGETLLQAIAREVVEETALVVSRFAFVCLHEAVDAAAGVHAVIAVCRGVGGIEAQARAGDDAADLALRKVADLRSLEDEGCLTPGLAGIVEAAHREHRRDVGA